MRIWIALSVTAPGFDIVREHGSQAALTHRAAANRTRTSADLHDDAEHRTYFESRDRAAEKGRRAVPHRVGGGGGPSTGNGTAAETPAGSRVALAELTRQRGRTAANGTDPAAGNGTDPAATDTAADADTPADADAPADADTPADAPADATADATADAAADAPADGETPADDAAAGNGTADTPAQDSTGGQDDGKGDVLAAEEKALEGAEQAVEGAALEASTGTGKALGAAAGDVLGESARLGSDVLRGNVTDIEHQLEGGFFAEFISLKPCAPDDLNACLSKTMLVIVYIFLSYAFFIFQVAGRRLAKTDEPLKKDAFTGNMQPVELQACPGGAGSKLCLASYFCNCWLRLETLAKLEGWDARKQNLNSLICVFMFGCFHLFSLTLVAGLGFGEHNQQDVSAIGLLSAPIMMVLLGYKLATWRVKLKLKGLKEDKKAEGDADGAADLPKLTPKEILLSSFAAPCAGGQEVEFIEKYEETFDTKEW